MNEYEKKFKLESVHISKINSGDAILFHGEIRTVCNRTIKSCNFMGKSLFGDSYSLGNKLVERVVF